MFFSELKQLVSFGCRDEHIYLLDAWLGTVHQSTQEFVSPKRFSMDAGIDLDSAIYIFAACTQAVVNVLRARFCLRCPICDYPAQTYEQLSAIPCGRVLCDACGSEISAQPDSMSLWFQLVRTPDPFQYPDRPFALVRGNYYSYEEEDYGLSPEEVMRSPWQLVRSMREAWTPK